MFVCVLLFFLSVSGSPRRFHASFTLNRLVSEKPGLHKVYFATDCGQECRFHLHRRVSNCVVKLVIQENNLDKELMAYFLLHASNASLLHLVGLRGVAYSVIAQGSYPSPERYLYSSGEDFFDNIARQYNNPVLIKQKQGIRTFKAVLSRRRVVVRALVLELCKGGTLLENSEKISFLRRLKDIQHVLLGLQSLHAAGVVHGEIHQQNILRCGDRGQVVKLTDFDNSIERYDSASDTLQEAMDNYAVRYEKILRYSCASPEMLVTKDTFGASDIFVLGLVATDYLTDLGNASFTKEIHQMFHRNGERHAKIVSGQKLLLDVEGLVRANLDSFSSRVGKVDRLALRNANSHTFKVSSGKNVPFCVPIGRLLGIWLAGMFHSDCQRRVTAEKAAAQMSNLIHKLEECPSPGRVTPRSPGLQVMHFRYGERSVYSRDSCLFSGSHGSLLCLAHENIVLGGFPYIDVFPVVRQYQFRTNYAPNAKDRHANIMYCMELMEKEVCFRSFSARRQTIGQIAAWLAQSDELILDNPSSDGGSAEDIPNWELRNAKEKSVSRDLSNALLLKLSD